MTRPRLSRARHNLLPVLALASLVGGFPLPLAAITIGCNEYTPAMIDVKPVYDETVYEFREPMMRIREISEKSGKGAQSESWPVGLSTGQLYMRINSEIYKSRTAYDPTTCGQLKGLHVELGFVNNQIYVAREFPRRSCPYKTVLEHEEKHKAVDRALLEEYTDKAQSFFKMTAMDIGVIRNGSGAALESQIDDALNVALDKFSQNMETERRKRQKEVDTAEEYSRVSAACEGTLMQIVQERLELLEQTYPGITKNDKPMSMPAPRANADADAGER